MHELTDISHSAPPDLLTRGEAAAELTVSRRSVERLLASGDLPAVRIGASVRIDRRDLREFIDSHRTTAKDSP